MLAMEITDLSDGCPRANALYAVVWPYDCFSAGLDVRGNDSSSVLVGLAHARWMSLLYRRPDQCMV